MFKMPRQKKSEKFKEGEQKTYFLKSIVFCPKCKSTDVVKQMDAAGVPNVGALIQMNICQNCGFQNRIFPEISEDEVNHLEKLRKGFKKVGREK